MNLVPRPVLIGTIWPGVGQQVHIRVRVGDEWFYTSRVLRKGESLLELVKETRQIFRHGEPVKCNQESI